MKLSDIKTFVVGNPPPHNGSRYFVFVKLITDGRVEGWGRRTACPSIRIWWRACSRTSSSATSKQDPHDIESMWRRVYSAGFTQHPDLTLMGVLSALEMACWDIIGKEAGQPVYKLLGGRVHERLRSYTYLYARAGDRSDVYMDPDLAAERAAEYLAQGFTALKFDPAGPYSAFDGRQLRSPTSNAASASCASCARRSGPRRICCSAPTAR
jgi:galactonate dehydratase